ncbi:MAG: hypothetical protein M3160_02370 [Candidatus Eremiobacteraeota bacterium]|nr:hypothetical protein [Candidatus Eremiobacteraeota bacterium]
MNQSTTVEQIRRAIAGAFKEHCSAPSYEQVLAALLTHRRPCELVFDDIDLALPVVRQELNALLHESPPQTTYIFASRTRSVVNFASMLAHGTVVLCDASMLHFNGEDIAALADALGVVHLPAEVKRLREESDGWAAVVGASVRHALTSNRSLNRAYEHWHWEMGYLFVGFIRAEIDRVFAKKDSNAQRILSGANGGQVELESLEQRGLFVKRVEDRYEPYRPVRGLLTQYAAPLETDQQGSQPLIVRLLGRFEATINGQPVIWARRRDQQIFKYLLLKANGSASRLELIETFWAGTDNHLASQSLRTACSNIRKSLAAVVPYDLVEHYFAVGAEVVIHSQRTVLDVRRFCEHVRRGDDEYGNGNALQARGHYRAAERLYGGPLLCGDEPQEWFVSQAQVFGNMFRSVLERLAALASENHDAQTASDYFRKLQQEDANTLFSKRRVEELIAPPT